MLEMAVRGCLSLSYSEIMSSIFVPRLPGEQGDSRKERKEENMWRATD